jgi:hypothetical protein
VEQTTIEGSFMTNDRTHLFCFAYAVLFLSSILQAQETCPVELKLLFSPPAIQAVMASFKFDHETKGQVYFFDTAELDLLRQGVIVRVRQGTNNDLTIKVRAAEGNTQVESQLRPHFPCEIDRTGAGENTSYSVQRKYKTPSVPKLANKIAGLLGRPQQRLLQEAQVSIDWTQVTRFASIQSTKWEANVQLPFRKFSLELWEWPGGSILELSTRVEPGAGQSGYAELQRLVASRSLPLSAKQGTKTRMVLEALTQHTSPLR